MNIQSKEIAICVGAQKAGTSWLFKCLEEHPRICAAAGKETNFFTKNVPISQYSSFFTNCSDNQILFEASPLYLSDYDTPSRIISAFEEVKIIIILRNPVDRAFSHYRHLKNKGVFLKNESLDEALNLNPEIIFNSKYSIHLKRYREVFNPEDILVLDFTEISNNPQNVIDKVCVFLGIETFTPKFLRTKYNTNSARSNPLYQKITWVYITLNNKNWGRALLKVLRKVGIDSSKNELILSALPGKDRSKDVDTSILKETLADEVSFYNKKYDY